MAWRRRLKRSWFLEIWKMALLVIYGGVLGKREIIGFLRVRLGPIKSSLYFFRSLYSWSQVLDDGTNLTFLNFINKINQTP